MPVGQNSGHDSSVHTILNQTKTDMPIMPPLVTIDLVSLDISCINIFDKFMKNQKMLELEIILSGSLQEGCHS